MTRIKINARETMEVKKVYMMNRMKNCMTM